MSPKPSITNDGSVDFSKPANITYLAKDHPEANGRVPQPGEVSYRVRFTLEQDLTLDVLLGAVSLAYLDRLLTWVRCDEALSSMNRSSGETS